MTISSAIRKAGPFLGNGVTTSFPFAFKVFQASDLQLIKTTAAGTDLPLSLNSDYSIALNADQNASPGGTITYPLTGSILASGEKLTATGVLEPLQETHLTNGGNFFANNIEDQMDFLTILIQQQNEKLSRVALASSSDSAPVLSIGTALQRALKYIAFDADGNLSLSATLPAGTLSQSSIISFLGADPIPRRTAAEIAAGTVPVDYTKFPSPWKDISRYVTDNTGVTDVSAAFAKAIAAEKNIIIPAGTYNLGTTGIVIPSNVRMQGSGRGNTFFTYAGSGIAIDGFNTSQVALTDFSLTTTALAATGMRFGNSCQHIHLHNLELHGNTTASNTGIGLLLDAGNPGAFSGNLLAQLLYTLGYKWGIKCTGHDTAVNTWTSMSFLQCFILGRSAGIISGSAGLWMDALTNGVGSVFHGGSIEGFDVGLKVDPGSYGLDFRGDLEGNNTLWTTGNTFSGSIKELNNVGSTYEAAANAAVNRWYARSQLNGVLIDEAWFEHDIVLYDSGGFAPVSIYRGASLANGGTPTLKFQFATGNSSGDNGANRNYLQFPTGNRIFAGTGSPENVVTAPVGSLYMRSDGGAATSLYVKETGVSNTGWIGK